MPYSKKLTINGYTPPAPDEGGIVIGKQKIWSENTKRTASCKMVGDIKAIKTTLSVTWSKLKQEDLTNLDNAINKQTSPFFPITYDDETGTQATKTFYSDSSIEYTRKIYRNGTIEYADVSVTFIEQ